MESINAYCELGEDTEVVLTDWPDSDINDLIDLESDGSEGLILTRAECKSTNCRYLDRCSQRVVLSNDPKISYTHKAIIYNVYWRKRSSI